MSHTPPTRDDRPASPLSVPVFRAIWVANLFSNFGGLIQSVGAAWLMTTLHASPQMIALVQASTTLPIMMLSLVAGAIADNLDRRRVMLAAQSFMLAVSLALSITAWSGLISPWTLLIFTFLIGCGTALNNPAWQASVADMVPRPLLPGAVSFNSIGFNIARSTGPAVGGLIVAVAGSAAAFAINAASYLGLIAVLRRWRPAIPPRRLPPEPLASAIGAGLRYVGLSPHIRVVLLRAAIFGFGGSGITALLPLVARDLPGGGPGTYGILLGAFGVGAIAGAYGASRVRHRLSSETLLRFAAGAMAVGVAATALGSNLFVLLPALSLAGAGWLVAMSTFNVSVQMASPRWVAARAIATYQTCAFGGMAIGSWVVGHFASDHGVAAALLGTAAVQVFGGLAGLILPVAPIGDLDLSPTDRWREPDVAIPLTARSGPIAIHVEHRVAEADVELFLDAMAERRRIRIRNGAGQWTLQRDLADVTLWVERFRFATWLDYVRHNERQTNTDLANSERLRTLRLPGTSLVVHRYIERETAPIFGSASPAAIDPTI